MGCIGGRALSHAATGLCFADTASLFRTLDGYRSGWHTICGSGTALAGSSSAALVGYVVGAEVLPRGRLVVGPSVDPRHNGVVHAHRHLVGGISLPDTDQWTDRIVRVDS